MRESGEDVQLVGGTWVYNQPTQVTDHSSITDPIPEFPGGFQPNEATSTTRKGPEHHSVASG